MTDRTDGHIPDGWRLVNEVAPPGTYKRFVRWLTIHADEADGQCIAEVTGEELDDDQRVAIATLIAAAPETARQRDLLLTALRAVVRSTGGGGPVPRPPRTIPKEIREQAKAALAECEATP